MGEKEFEIGDIVKLRSGGLPMTVVFVGDRAVEVAFYTDGRFSRQRIPQEALVIVAVADEAA